MQNQQLITIPSDWTIPQYRYGQRTKLGLIVSLNYYPPGSLIADIRGEQWHYGVLSHNDEVIKYCKENEVQPLTDEEVKAAILSEIEAHKQKIVILTQQLMTINQQ